MEFDIRTGCYKIDIDFQNFEIQDLTNYPNTITKLDPKAIKP